MDIKTRKQAVRAEALGRRDRLDPHARVEAAMTMAEHGSAIDIGPGEIVSGFLPIRSEADIRPLMFQLMSQGAALCVPAILDKQTIVFRRLARGAPLVDMGFGTFGPGPDAEVLKPTLMLVPLAAFDRHGHRVGYGAGYYDRAIARLQAMRRSPRLIGIAFDCQEVDAVPIEAHDVPLPAILTESGLRTLGGEGDGR